MKDELIKVEYVEQSSESIFFDVTMLKNYYFFWWFIQKETTRRAILKKETSFKTGEKRYGHGFIWFDNNSSCFDDNVKYEMILKYENENEPLM